MLMQKEQELAELEREHEAEDLAIAEKNRLEREAEVSKRKIEREAELLKEKQEELERLERNHAELEDSAAVKLQASVRRKEAKAVLEEKRRQHQAEVAKHEAKQKAAQAAEAEALAQGQAAVKLQSSVRRREAKAMVAKKRRQHEEAVARHKAEVRAAAEAAEQDRAAVLLQSSVRRREAKTKVAKVRLEHETEIQKAGEMATEQNMAATKLQASVRRREAKGVVAKKRRRHAEEVALQEKEKAAAEQLVLIAHLTAQLTAAQSANASLRDENEALTKKLESSQRTLSLTEEHVQVIEASLGKKTNQLSSLESMAGSTGAGGAHGSALGKKKALESEVEASRKKDKRIQKLEARVRILLKKVDQQPAAPVPGSRSQAPEAGTTPTSPALSDASFTLASPVPHRPSSLPPATGQADSIREDQLRNALDEMQRLRNQIAQARVREEDRDAEILLLRSQVVDRDMRLAAAADGAREAVHAAGRDFMSRIRSRYKMVPLTGGSARVGIGDQRPRSAGATGGSRMRGSQSTSVL